MHFYARLSPLARRFAPQFTTAQARIHFIGPCGIMYMQFIIPNVGEIYILECHTPKAPLVTKTDFIWWADKNLPRALVWYVVGMWYSQWLNDIFIWENKVYRRPPVILKTDGPVNKFRRWYSQFYSPSSGWYAAKHDGSNLIMTTKGAGAAAGEEKATDGGKSDESKIASSCVSACGHHGHSHKAAPAAATGEAEGGQHERVHLPKETLAW